ncbi:IS481 family transposase [Microbacterium halophytorum]|uniref:IS481 family transposase n=1 Tax=Microbacterium halophytorum TaxID=2067568 RepID=UPI001E3848B3|nr:IS481 family transposase [Microbacterium halophytorum]
MSQASSVLAPRTRLRLARLIIDDHYSIAVAARLFMVSPVTARKWAAYCRSEGAAGMQERSSRPHRIPHKAAEQVKKRITSLRWRLRLCPAQIAGRLGLAASIVHAVLTRCGVNRLSHIDRVTGEPLRRCEYPYPGPLIHVDVTKFDNIPDGGGWRFVGKQQGDRNREATAKQTGKRHARLEPNVGTGYVRTVFDDNSRVAYAEICTDEKAVTAIGVLERAVARFAECGASVERVLSDNGSAYKSFAWRGAGARLGITHKRTRPYRPQTNGKSERFHHTLADGWAYAGFYASETERRAPLPRWLHFYNHHRHHSAVSGPPISRLNNLPGHHNRRRVAS